MLIPSRRRQPVRARASAHVRDRTLNFVLAGQVRSGSSVLGDSLSLPGYVVCHNEVLAGPVRTQETEEQRDQDAEARLAAHEDYFGSAPVCPWLTAATFNPNGYAENALFDHPRDDERVCGVRLPYPVIRAHEMYSLCDKLTRVGDFCLILVQRNPVVCFVSYQQALQTNRWRRLAGAPDQPPASLYVELSELVAFIREHQEVEAKLKAACPDRLDLTYAELLYDFRATWRKVMAFLELPDLTPTVPNWARLRNHELSRRVVNWEQLVNGLPRDLRPLCYIEDNP